MQFTLRFGTTILLLAKTSRLRKNKWKIKCLKEHIHWKFPSWIKVPKHHKHIWLKANINGSSRKSYFFRNCLVQVFFTQVLQRSQENEWHKGLGLLLTKLRNFFLSGSYSAVFYEHVIIRPALEKICHCIVNFTTYIIHYYIFSTSGKTDHGKNFDLSRNILLHDYNYNI